MIYERLPNGYVQFIPETAQEVHSLRKVPAFEERNGKYLAPYKIPVLQNISSRIEGLANNPWASLKPTLLDLPSAFQFHTEPLRHQLIATRYLYTNKGGGLLLDPGLGKTKIALDYMSLAGFRRILVICPKPLTFVWDDEVATHRPDLSKTIFTTTDWSEHASRTAKVWVMNYRKAVLLLPELMGVKFDAMFIDEGLVKNPKSEQTKAITLLAKSIDVRVIMSGTLINNSEIDLFSPVHILEPSLVGSSYTKFRDTYFNTWNPSKDEQKKHIRIISGAKDKEMMRAILRSCSLVMRKEDWLNLPSKTFIERVVPLPRQTAKHYYELLSNYITKIGDTVIECDNPLSLLCKLTQISNGFAYENEDGFEDLFLPRPKTKTPKRSKKTRPTFFFPEQPKIAELRHILLVDIPEERAIIWYSMDAERVLIEKLLTELGLSFLTIGGGDKQLRQKVKSFNSDNTIKALLCQAKTLNYGVTILGQSSDVEDETKDEDEGVTLQSTQFTQSVCTQIFYSLTNSLEVFLQQQDRIHRIGQVRDCTYYMLLSNSPVERAIMDRLNDKIEIRQYMLEDILKKSVEDFAYLV